MSQFIATLKPKKEKRPLALKIAFWIFVLYSFTLLFPFLWLIYNSLKSKQEFLMGNPWAMPQNWLFSNYIDIFNPEYGFDLLPMFFNSISLVIGQVSTGLLISACAAYAVAKHKFIGRNVIYTIAIMIMFIPTTGSLAVMYKFMSDTKMMDTYWGMILMSAGGFGFNFFILYGFFKNISDTYGEAASIDGAGHWTIFLRIILPQAKAALFALGIMGVIGVWNDYMGPLLYYKSHPTVAVGIKNLSDYIVSYGSDYPRYFAAILISTLPVIIIYACFQKMIIENTMAGGLKG